VAKGDKSWYFMTVDYALGISLQAEASKAITALGGTVVGSVRHGSSPLSRTTEQSLDHDRTNKAGYRDEGHLGSGCFESRARRPVASIAHFVQWADTRGPVDNRSLLMSTPKQLCPRREHAGV
jgi:hypothetical protein